MKVFCLGKYWAMFYFHLKSNEMGPLKNFPDWTLWFQKFQVFWEKYIALCILKGILPFKMHKIIFFPDNLKKFLGFTSKARIFLLVDLQTLLL